MSDGAASRREQQMRENGYILQPGAGGVARPKIAARRWLSVLAEAVFEPDAKNNNRK